MSAKLSGKVDLAKVHVDKLVSFLSLHVKLSQGHMVDYFTHSLFENCIPKELRDEISSFGLEATVDYLLDTSNESKTAPQGVENLRRFMHEAKGYSLYNLKDICVGKSEFYSAFGFENEAGLKLDVFMKSKKSHEVETLSIVAKNIARKTGTSHLVDIGDGKGYLSSLIAFHHKLPVLGVDGSLVNTESSIKRANRLEKHWEHVALKEKPEKDAPRKKYNDRILLYKQITQLVTESTDFDELIRNVFLETPSGIGLVGLHTCGNLGPTSVRIFNENARIHSIINVSCCYHLLNEKYLANSSMGCIRDSKQGFPMSAHLGRGNVTLGRATRMLSAHSLDRILHNRELPSKIIFYRSLLEVILFNMQLSGENRRNVGKFRRQPENFTQYAREAAVKLGITLEHTDNDLEALYESYKHRRKELIVFYLVRSMLAPAIEALILLDRYLFLLEQGHDNVHLVQLFDPVISPRCYGLICLRN